MKKYKIELYKMKYVGGRYFKFKPRRYFKTFNSLSELAKFIIDNDIYCVKLFEYITAQLTRKETRILITKLFSMHSKNAL